MRIARCACLAASLSLVGCPHEPPALGPSAPHAAAHRRAYPAPQIARVPTSAVAQSPAGGPSSPSAYSPQWQAIARPSALAFSIACSSDASCLSHRCNPTTHACAIPCGGPADCASWATCMAGVCVASLGFPAPAAPPAPAPPAQPPPPPPPAPGAPPGGDYDYRAAIRWTQVPLRPWSGDDGGSPLLRDVMNHTTDRWTGNDGFSTIAHETAHGLHNDMRNATDAHDNFCFFQQGFGAYVLEPRTQLGVVRSYVPPGAARLAQDRYQTYVIDQAAHWSEVLYLFDEWTAYVVGGRVAIDVVRAGRWPPSAYQDEVDGMMDLLYFSAAGMLAVHDLEPATWAGDPQLRATFAWLAETTMGTLSQGLAIPQFQGFHAAELRDHFVASPENARIRGMLQAWYGPGWTRRVFGF